MGIVNDIRENIPEPKPAYNTVSTFVKLLESKGFVKHNANRRPYIYFPIITKEEYCDFKINKMINQYFMGSNIDFIYFLSKTLCLSELEINKSAQIFQSLLDDK